MSGMAESEVGDEDWSFFPFPGIQELKNNIKSYLWKNSEDIYK